MGEEAGLVPCLCRTELTRNGHEHGVGEHGEVTRVPPTGSHSLGGTASARSSADGTASATDPPLAAGDERSLLLKLDQRNPAWIKLGFFKIFFPPLLAVFFFWRERHCLL